jgi:hypothetical protein
MLTENQRKPWAGYKYRRQLTDANALRVLAAESREALMARLRARRRKVVVYIFGL